MLAPASRRCWNARRPRFPSRIPHVSPMLRAGQRGPVAARRQAQSGQVGRCQRGCARALVAHSRLCGYRVHVAERRWAGSWLSGVAPDGDKTSYPGQQLGLPESGPGSVAGVGRPLGALLIDWLLCAIIAVALFHSLYLTFAVFAVENYLLIALTGFTAGKRGLGLRGGRPRRHPPAPLSAPGPGLPFLAARPPPSFVPPPARPPPHTPPPS